MALNHDDLLALLKELQLTETTGQIRAATQRLYQQLIDAEATAISRSAGSAPATMATSASATSIAIVTVRLRFAEP